MGGDTRNSRWTYARAGVDRGRVSEALKALLREVRYRPPPAHGRPVEVTGHYAGMVRIGRETIAITTDTVGTKVLLAAELHRWEGVGEDVVQVNVNDLAAVGARPSAFVDTILCSRPDPEVFRSIGRGIERGLRASGCALLGGETAVVPDILEEVDLGGTAIGFFPSKRSPVTGERIRWGDAVIGIPSHGFHANGYTLIRRLLEENRVDLSRPREGAAMPLGEELLQPGRIYTGVSEALAGLPEVHGFAHISGGGVRNLTRLNPRARFVLDGWPAPEGLFEWVQELGQIPGEELYQTFNTGIGFAVIARPVRLSALLRRLARAGAPDARVVGHVERGGGVELPHLDVRYEGYA
ncbi:MAG: phosphoribosylformylglycinamidine cyclo-ligase [Thermoplasmata archaeon]|nr:phosphoribosylformylglycinamidine cyclo-ligase [Thermoplasmata archaeon]